MSSPKPEDIGEAHHASVVGLARQTTAAVVALARRIVAATIGEAHRASAVGKNVRG